MSKHQGRKAGNRFGQWLVYFLIRIVVCVVQSLSMDSCQRLARWLAWLAYDVLRIRRKTTDENLRHAFPEWTDRERMTLARRMWEHMTLMLCEIVHVPRKIHETNWREYVHIPRDEMRVMVEHLLSPRPSVLVSGHFGNFEVGGVVSGLLGFPTFTVARPLDNPYLHTFVTRFRERTGQFMLPKRGSARQLDAILQAGGTMVLLADQAAGPKGCWVEFFGRPASCNKAVALFSLVNRAPMLMVYSRRKRPLHFEIGVTAVFDPLKDEMAGVKPLTQWYNRQLEAMVRRAPEQYWWLHDRWKLKPDWKIRGLPAIAHPPHASPVPPKNVQVTPNHSATKTSSPTDLSGPGTSATDSPKTFP